MEKPIGPEAKLKVEMVNGKMQISVNYDGKQVDAMAAISADSDLLIDAIMDLVPGDSGFEKTMAALLKAALKSVAV